MYGINPSCRIAHLADIHWRSLSNHAAYVKVFEAFAADVVKYNIEHVYVGGDIFHTKTVGISPEYIQHIARWMKLLSKHAILHMTLGNHDGNISNMSRQDAISPIVEIINDPRIKLYKQSGTYNFAPGFNWCVFSLFDEPGWPSVKPVLNEINIACYHGPVYGAQTESGWDIHEGLNVDFFKDYEFAFLGDIHKTQFLDYRDSELVIDESDLHLYPGAEIIEMIEE